jgi:hypothetical protein
MSYLRKTKRFNFKLLLTFIFLVYTKPVKIKVVHPLMMNQHTKCHGPTLTGSSFLKFERPPFWNG